jgi:mannitol 2-dehydrogenase
MYVDRLLATSHLDWAVTGLGVLDADRRLGEALLAQDGLYTLVLKHPDGSLESRVIGSLVGYRLLSDDPLAATEQLAAPEIRIVSLTITEGGYAIHPLTGEFNADDPAVLADLPRDAVPRTVFGLVVGALERRRARGTAPFSVMSCDNIEGNGRVARRAFAAFARLRDPALGEWVDSNVHFPSSMVDRITPVTTDTDRAVVEQRYGVRDRCPVVCEPFVQWVLEDDFGPGGRPPFEAVGVHMVTDVAPYELMKLRLLNASHQALAYLGYLMGYRHVHEAAADPLLARLLRAYMDEEATPTLRPVPGVDVESYKSSVVDRFANPCVRDTLARICTDTSDRIPKFLLPVVLEQLDAGRQVRLSALVVASWARYAEGVDEQGQPIDVVDPRRDELVRAAGRQRQDVTAFLQVRDVFGDLAEHEEFTAAYAAVLTSLQKRGARATLERMV